MVWFSPMSTSLGHGLAVTALRIADLFRLRPIMRWVFARLPKTVRYQVNLLQVRFGVMEGLIKVPEADLVAGLKRALREVGADSPSPGDAYLEFGVYVGTSMACMYEAATAVGADELSLVGFDSFDGMPDSGEGDGVWTWQPGQLYSDIRLTRANLRRLGVPARRVKLVRGWFEESLTDATRSRLGLRRAPVIMMDCVLESSTRTALEFCTPLITDRSVVYFDDWSAADLANRGLGEARALENWLSDHPEMMAEPRPDLAYGKDSQAFVVARRSDAGTAADRA